MNAARGASALVGVARVVMTLFPMSEHDAKVMGVPAAERHKYVRLDDAKANLSLVTHNARWFQKETVILENGGPAGHGDAVGALKPFAPDLMEGVSVAVANAILDEIEKGPMDADGEPTGARYSAKDTKRGSRWAGHVIIRHVDMAMERAAKILSMWERNGVLVERDYYDKTQRKTRKGVSVNNANRPGRETD